MRISSILNASLLGLLGVAACGGSSSSIPIDKVGAESVTAVCTKIFACCDASERMGFFGAQTPATEADCETSSFGQFLAASAEQQKAQVSAGKETYDGAAAGDCIDSINSTACTAFSPISFGSDACRKIYDGTAAAGAACASDDECKGDAFCKGFSQSAAGMCVTLPKSGEACPDERCTSDSYCKDGTCAAPQANGATCTSASECQSGNCDASGMCAAKPVSMTCDGQ
jgi:hypothetical protein